MTYASPVWWRGVKRQPPPPRRAPGRAAPAPKPVGVQGAVGIASALDRVQNMAMRIILPVWRTTPIMALQCEASLPPMAPLLDYLLERYSIRTRTLPSLHPVTRRTAGADDELLRVAPRQTNPLLDKARATQLVESHRTTAAPPWGGGLAQHPGFTLQLPDGRDKETVPAQHPARASGDHGTVQVYTDGSLQLHGRNRKVGAAYVVYWCTRAGTECITERSINLRPDSEIFDAEAYGLLRGVSAACDIASRTGAEKVSAFIDNSSVLQALVADAHHNSISGKFLASLREKILSWMSNDPARQVCLSWTPGHSSVVGNERADQKAKEGASAIRADERKIWPTQSLASARRTAKEKMVRQWQHLWSVDPRHRNYRRLRTTPPSLKPGPHLASMPRKVLGLWLQAKTGHGDFAPYHQRPQFKHPDAHLFCRCEQLRNEGAMVSATPDVTR
ncbi:unnamed protein product [Tilletia laevis]|nr:unnamed protein product [Tilletia laevis]